jgi:hypothetical protein
MNRCLAFWGWIALGLSIGGCSHGDGPELGSVRGTVSLDGQPVAGARVTFWLGKGRPSIGFTDEAGRYQLRYTVNQDGALIGEHRVYISTAIAQDEEDTAPAERIPDRFNGKSTLVREVKPGSNIIDFDIQSS